MLIESVYMYIKNIFFWKDLISLYPALKLLMPELAIYPIINFNLNPVLKLKIVNFNKKS